MVTPSIDVLALQCGGPLDVQLLSYFIRLYFLHDNSIHTVDTQIANKFNVHLEIIEVLIIVS